jgi:short-subunit dehydrogenase
MGQRRHIAGSRILITGASQGIGKALAEAAAQRGARVLATARSAELLETLVQPLRAQGAAIEAVAADVTAAEDRRHIVEQAVRCFGGLDILVNNAGIGATGHFVECAPDRLRKIMEVNFFGLTEMTRVCLPLLKQGNRPAVVNISSVAGKRALPARSEYSASKYAVEGFSEALRTELAKDGIDVIVVCPGLTQTNFSQNMLEQKARMAMDHMRGMTAEAVATATVQAIEKGKREVVLTLSGKLICLVSRWFPSVADRIVRRKVRALFEEEIAARQAQRQRAAAPQGEKVGG